MMDDFQKAQADRAGTVRQMFDRVANKYDLFNRLCSLGLDEVWRRKAVKHLEKDLPAAGRVLDLGCGSGDLGSHFKQAKVWGADFALQMLRQAKRKYSGRNFTQADACCLPMQEHIFDGVATAFVIRNVADIPGCMKEVLRVLKPGGKFVILEFSLPKNPLMRLGFQFYLRTAFPFFCLLFAGDQSAYRYLRCSIQQFSREVDLLADMRKSGFINTERVAMLFGGVAIISGVKPRVESLD